jgi:hypothetical protein
LRFGTERKTQVSKSRPGPLTLVFTALSAFIDYGAFEPVSLLLDLLLCSTTFVS